MSFKTIEWLDKGALRLIDQRQLPIETVYADFTDYKGVATAIREMVVRGAPAIGATAGYGMALTAFHSDAESVEELRAELETAAEVLRTSRPTAVNLFWAIDRMLRLINDNGLASVEKLKAATINEAHAIADEDVQTNKNMGLNALPLIPDEALIIHHCTHLCSF